VSRVPRLTPGSYC